MDKSQPSLLWSVKFANSNYSSYLLGTMHVDTTFTKEVFHEVIPILEECKFFYTEVDFSTMEKDNSVFFSEDKFQLKNYLSPRKYVKLRKIILKSFGIDLDFLTNYKAMIIMNSLAESILDKKSNQSLDLMLSNHAINYNLVVGGIETYEDQMDLMHGFDEKEHIAQLIAVGRNPSKFRRNILKLNEQYVNQDVSGLYKSSKKGLGKLKHKLLYERNKKMSLSIKEKAHLGNSFFAFGVGHLAGKYGILRHLKLLDAEITPIKLNF